jgi:hypothetical protein
LNLILLLLAARSVFASSGQIATGTGRATLALTVSIAFLVMFTFLASGIESYRVRRALASVGAAAVNRHYEVLFGPQGRPWLGREDYTQEDGTYQLTQAAEMAPGRSVRDQLQPVAEGWKKTPSWAVDLYYVLFVRGYWARFTQIAAASSSSPAEFVRTTWVFDHREQAILVYRLTLSGQWQLVRRLHAPDSARSFGQVKRVGPTDKQGNFALVTSKGAFYVPGDGSAVVTMYQAPPSLAILDSVEHARDKNRPFAMMLRLADRLVLLESNLDEIAASQAKPIGEVANLGHMYATEVQLPGELAKPKSLSIARDPLHNGAYLGLAQSGDPNKRRIVWARFDASGRIAAQQEYIENTGSAITSDGLAFSAIVPPGVWAIVFSTVLVSAHDPRIDDAWEKAWEEAREDPLKTAGAVLLYLLPGIVGMPLAMWAARRRRLDRRQTWLWIAGGFLMGPAGSLSILAVYPRIVREGCISCLKPTRIDVELCEHCGHRLDDVPRLGIEIFDRDTPATSRPPETIGSC